MKDYRELKILAEAIKGWDKMTECWPSDENGPDWQIGRLDEEDNRWPLMTVDTEQYDQEQDAPKIAQYYAAANPAAVLELIAEVEALKGQLECADEQVVFLEKQAKQLILESVSIKKDAARYRTIKKDSISDGSLIERLDCNFIPSEWDSYIDSVSVK